MRGNEERKTMKLSIVIVNYRVQYLLEQCLLSVRRALKGIEGEVFVVDNDSQDDSLAYLQPRFPEVTFIANHENVGFSRANNQAIRLAKGEYVLLLNPDTLLVESTLHEVLDFMDRTPSAGAVGLKMIDSTGRFLPESKRSLPTPWVSFCKIFGLSQLFPQSQTFNRYALGYLSAEEKHVIDVLAGAFMMMRREALEKVGLLDERFFMYGEDIDLSYRIQQGGYDNYYLPISMLHYKGESTPKDSIRYIRVFYEAMDLFYKKHHPQASVLLAIPIRLAILFRALLALMFRTLRFVTPRKQEVAERVYVCTASSHEHAIRALLESTNLAGMGNQKSVDEMLTIVKNQDITKVILSDSLFSYDEMITFMEAMYSQKITFGIHTQKSATIVSSNQYYH